MGTFYSIPLSLAAVACILVGRNIGKGRVEKAKLYAKQGFIINFSICIFPCLLLLTIPNKIVQIFTNN